MRILARARSVFLDHEVTGKRPPEAIQRLNCGCIATVPWAAKALSTDFDRGGTSALPAGAGVVSDKSKLVPRYQLRGRVIFVRDVECRLQKLNEFDRKLLTRIIFQEYTHDEAAEMLGCRRRTIGRRFAEAVDRLTGFLLDAGLLLRLPEATSKAQKSCQEGENIEISVSYSEEGE